MRCAQDPGVHSQHPLKGVPLEEIQDTVQVVDVLLSISQQKFVAGFAAQRQYFKLLGSGRYHPVWISAQLH
jgi:hypothetical protein